MGGAPSISMPPIPTPSDTRKELALLMEQQRQSQADMWQQRQEELKREEENRLATEEAERRRLKQQESEELRVVAEQERLAIAESEAVVEGDYEEEGGLIIDFYSALLEGQDEESAEDLYPE